MSSAASSRTAPPPSQQEVTRKLSVHAVARTNIKKPSIATGALSGGESDSDSVFAPDAASPPPLSPTGLHAGSLAQPLQSIAERTAGSGEESEEDEEEDDGEWRAESREQAAERGARDETVLKTGYLWKKGERRKTWKKRWFVLRPAHLAFYKTAAEYKLLRLLDLSDVHSCTAVQLKKHAHTFCVISPTRTFYLQAAADHDVAGWVAAINDARTALLETETQSSATAPIPIPRAAPHAPYAAASPSASHSHSPYTHHLTSSDSDDNASPSKPRSYPTSPPAADPSAAPRIDGGKVILNGYLMKCGSRRHTWHNRWFVLSGDKLVYSRSHMDTKPHRALPLAQLLDALEYDLPPHRHTPAAPAPPPPHPARDDPGPHTFKIVTTKRTLLLCAPSEEEEIRWLSAVRALIARRSVLPGDSAGASGGGAAASAGPGGTSRTPSTPTPLDALAAAHPGSSANPGTPAAAATAGPTVPSAPAPAASTGTVQAAPSTHRRKDSIARRLSLSGSVGFSLHSGGVPQEA